MLKKSVVGGVLAQMITCGSLADGQAQDAAARALPRIVEEGGHQRVVWPSALASLVEKIHADYRLAGPEDIEGACVTTGRKGSCPFCVWGDFNGDGSTDVAAFLLTDTRWKLVVFSRIGSGFVDSTVSGGTFSGPDARVGSPALLRLALVEKGRKITWDHEDGAQREHRFAFDSMELIFVEDNQYYIYWEGGTFKEFSASVE